MLVKTFYDLIYLSNGHGVSDNKFTKSIAPILYQIRKRTCLKKIKDFINESCIFDILSEFVQFSDLFKQYFNIDLPFDNIRFEPNLVKMKTKGIDCVGRKVIYRVEDDNISMEIGAIIELGDDYKIVNLQVYDKIANSRLDSAYTENFNSTDGLVQMADKIIRSYTNYAVNYIIRYGMRCTTK